MLQNTRNDQKRYILKSDFSPFVGKRVVKGLSIPKSKVGKQARKQKNSKVLTTMPHPYIPAIANKALKVSP